MARRLWRVLGAALGVSDVEAAAAVAYTASRVRSCGVMLVVIVAVCAAVVWIATRNGVAIPVEWPDRRVVWPLSDRR